MSIVQANLKRIIDDKGLVQKGVAKRAGIPEKAFSAIMTGRKVIRADMIPALAAAVDEPIAELFRAEEKGA